MERINRSFTQTMFPFLNHNEPAPIASLGPLELQVLQTVWNLTQTANAVSVREVQDTLGQPLAYTTVSTTLDRLCKKNLLERHKVARAFAYRPAYSRRQLDEFEARHAIRNVSGAGQLISCLLDAVGQVDTDVLDELEEKIRRRRLDLGMDAEGGRKA